MKFFVVLFAAAFLGGCGYRVAGSARALPPEIHTIAVPAWNNGSVNAKLSGEMAEALSRELISRTRYSIVADPAKADAVIRGTVANMFAGASVVDPVSGRATGANLIVNVQVQMIDKNGKVLFNRPNLEFRERYEISVTPNQYFDESDAARARLARDVAQTIVSAILESF